MMVSCSISRKWYEEIKDLVKTENPFFFQDKIYGREAVEVDVDEEAFIRVSKKLGWM